MHVGIAVSRVDDLGLVQAAEDLGFHFAWVFDSPLIRSDMAAVLALAAGRTTTLRIGAGVAVPGLRLAPALAGTMATINHLAPGRTFVGVGTGNTAMRTLGQRPATIAAMREYVRVLRALLDGDEVEFSHNGETHPVRMVSPGDGYFATSPRLPIHISGFGPRAQALAGECGDALITGIPRGGSVPDALTNARRGAERVGRALPDDFQCIALVNLVLLRPGESLSDESVIRQCGGAIMANVHFAVDLVRETGCAPPDYVASIWDDYMAMHERRDAARRHQQMHASHYGALDADEARFITPDLIRRFCIAGRPDEVLARLRELADEGLDAIAFVPEPAAQYGLIEYFAQSVLSRL